MAWKIFSGEKRYKAADSRRYPRLKANYLMRYFVIAGAEQEEMRTANTKDISLNGLRFAANEALEAGQMLRVQVLIPALGDYVSAFARVENVERKGLNRFYTVSLSFVEFSRDDHKLLGEFIDSCAKVKEADKLFDRFSIAKRKVQA